MTQAPDTAEANEAQASASESAPPPEASAIATGEAAPPPAPAPLLKTPDLLSALGSIVNVEARHSAALRSLAGQDPSPLAFDKAKPADQVAVELKTIVQ